MSACMCPRALPARARLNSRVCPRVRSRARVSAHVLGCMCSRTFVCSRASLQVHLCACSRSHAVTLATGDRCVECLFGRFACLAVIRHQNFPKGNKSKRKLMDLTRRGPMARRTLRKRCLMLPTLVLTTIVCLYDVLRKRRWTDRNGFSRRAKPAQNETGSGYSLPRLS